MVFQLSGCRNIFIWGGGHGIGLALLKELMVSSPSAKIYASYRNLDKASELIELCSNFKDKVEIFKIDPTSEAEVLHLSEVFRSKGIEVDAFINCIGFLHSEEMQPEKSLRSVSVDQFIESFKVNSVVTAIIAKHFEQFLPRSTPCAFVCLSAKVGSIGDNKMGGWYSYRASKAALNMILQTIAIEFKRKKLSCLVVPIHPGTTKTELSKPFIKNTKYTLHSAEDSARNILELIDQRSTEESGSFLSWDGELIAW